MTQTNPIPDPPQRVTAPDLMPILEELARLEPAFHQPLKGTPRAQLEAMTVEDFWEIGASGRRYGREFVLGVLEERSARERGDVWDYTDFHLRELAPGVYLLTFALVQDSGRRTERATIWQRGPHGWQIVFHQGTVVV